MKICFDPDVYHKLVAYAAATRLEFSGNGFCRRDENGDIRVYDFVLLDVGTEGYTEIDPARLLPLLERKDKANMRVWIHRHPVEGWSSRDIQTILKEPLGSTPEAVGWSVSIVLTPKGFIGRIDNYKKKITRELEVTPNVSQEYGEIRALKKAATSCGDLFDETEDWAYLGDELDEDYDDCGGSPTLDDITARDLLQALSRYRVHPADVTLAEVLDEFGIAWETIRREA